MDNIKDNELMAVFMDWTYDGHGSYQNPEDDGDWWKAEDMVFDISWNWIMRVVDKIEELNYDFQIGSGMLARVVDIDCDRSRVMEEIETSYPTKIETVYRATLEFIKWYNEGK